jgi:hypothetical protein
VTEILLPWFARKLSFPNECWDGCLVLCILHEKDCFREYKLTTLPISMPWVNVSLQTFQRKLVRRCVFWDGRLGQRAEQIFPYTIGKKRVVLHCVWGVSTYTSAMFKPSWTYLAPESSFYMCILRWLFGLICWLIFSYTFWTKSVFSPVCTLRFMIRLQRWEILSLQTSCLSPLFTARCRFRKER